MALRDLRESLVEPNEDGEEVVIDDGEGKNEIEVEVYDDRPPEDRREPVDLNELDDDEDLSDEEIAALGKRAQKRIQRLTFKYNEARRQAEENARLQQEAIAVARRIKEQADAQAQTLSQYQTQLLRQRAEASTMSVAQAKAALATALEDGDPQAIAEAQAALTNASLAASQDKQFADYYSRRAQQPQQPRQPQQQIQQDAPPERPAPSEPAKRWAANNPWFGRDPELTSLAYGVHEAMVRSGLAPDTPEYYATLDRRMRELVPGKFGKDGGASREERTQETPASPRKSPVAPAARSSGDGSGGGKIRLSRSEVQIANALGVSLEAYAKQKVLEERRRAQETR